MDQFAYGITPYALERGKGAYFWDVDGNKYLDTSMSLAAVFLGYCNPMVDKAIQQQLKKGISFLKYRPAIIIRATQKKIMSGPVTRS